MSASPKSIGAILAGGTSETPLSDTEAMVENLRRMQARNKAEIAAFKATEVTAAASASSANRTKPGQGSPSKVLDEKLNKPASSDQLLPYWADNRRAVSNDMARSSLFTVRQKEKRLHFRAHSVATMKNVEIRYTGEELRQRDEDVLLQLMHFGRLAKVGEPIRFVAKDMLDQLGWGHNNRAYNDLAESIDRMKASSLQIVTRLSNGERRFGGSLVRSFETRSQMGDSRTEKWAVTFEPRIIALFSHAAYTQIDWDQRRKLSPIAKWMHSFYFTHQKPFPMKVATLRQLCGSASKELFRFRYVIRGALDELVTVGFLRSWALDKESDLVEVFRQHEPLLIESAVDRVDPALANS